MKRITVALSLVLGLCSISNMQAQMKIYNSNLVKFGDVNTNPILSSGFEVIMPKFLFKGSSFEYSLGIYSLEIKNNIISGQPSAGPSIVMLSVKNQFGIGNATRPLHSVCSNQLYSSSGGVSTISDRRCKTNIVELGASSDQIMRLRPVKFDYR